MATNYSINYEDQRFKNVEAEKNARLNEVNETYNNMINQSDAFYQRQIDATRDYATTQQDLQNQQTDLAVNEINQAKEKANKDYLREQRGAYTDWQKESNRYGAVAEQMAKSGLANTGYSESSQVSMYNTYQNRVATARESYNLAVQNYDNKIAEARLANNSKLAEIAYNALQQELELSLNGFQYKNTLLLDQVNKQQAISDTYYNRWQNVLSQMNTENALAEQIRQYNEKMAYQKQRDKVADAQWQKEFDLAKKASSSSRSYRSSGSSGGRTSKKGTTTNYDLTGKTTSNGSNVGNLAMKVGASAVPSKTSSKKTKAPSLSNSNAKELYKSAKSGKYTTAQIRTFLNSAVNTKKISSKDRDAILKSL